MKPRASNRYHLGIALAESSDTGLSVIVGKLSLVVGLLGGLIVLWTWYNSPGAELQATVEYGTYMIDPDTLSTLEKFDNIAEDFGSYTFQTGSLPQDLQKLIGHAYILSRDVSVPTGTRILGGYVKTDITNTGNLSAKEVALRVPDVYVSVVTYDDKSQKIFRDTLTIELGEIKPSQSVTVYSWAHMGLYSFAGYNNVSLVHANGKGSVAIKGRSNWFLEFITSPLGLLALIPIAWLVVMAYARGVREGRKATPAKPTKKAKPEDAV